MPARHCRARRIPLGLALMLMLAAVAAADWADIYLRSGLVLRAEIEEEPDAIVIRNEAGTARIPSAEIARIERLPHAPTSRAPSEASAPATAPSSRPPGSATQPGESLTATTSAPAEDGAPADDEERPREGGFPPPPLVSPRDIQRLRINELKLSGPPEKVRVRLGDRGQKVDLARRVMQQLESRPEADPQLLRVLARGEPHEKLQAIVKATGTQYADEIEIQSDPEVFALFKQQIAPRIMRGCARSGCHGGSDAQVFRFPAVSASNDATVYTLFAMLNELKPSSGALLDRTAPDQSRLLTYMLPVADNPAPHPAAADRKVKYMPLLKGRNDPQAALIESWIASLRRPRPDYALEYQLPVRR